MRRLALRTPTPRLYGLVLFLGACGSSDGGELYGQSMRDGRGPEPHIPAGGSGGWLPGTGGFTGGTGGFTGGAGGWSWDDAGAIDGGPPDLIGGCDFEGTWATVTHVPVTWPATPLVLLAGEGVLWQWNLSRRRHAGPETLSESSVPCGIFLPDLPGDFFAGFERYGIRFPDPIFDQGGVPAAPFTTQVTVGSNGVSFTTDPIAVLQGHTMSEPATAPWPNAFGLRLEDHDFDGKPGITVVPVEAPGYNYPPVDISLARADRIYIATRTVAVLSGTAPSCDELEGTVAIQEIAGEPGINSRVVGCRRLDNGRDCSPQESGFIDTNRPQYYPTGLGRMSSVRVPDETTCAEVRAMFPMPW